jgi:hypothetical protein
MILLVITSLETPTKEELASKTPVGVAVQGSDSTTGVEGRKRGPEYDVISVELCPVKY